MSDISQGVTLFLLNGIWQITAIALLALGSARLLRRLPARFAHRMWVLAMAACLVIPLATVLIQQGAARDIDGNYKQASPLVEPLNSTPTGFTRPFRALSHSISVPPVLSQALLGAFSVLLLYTTTRLLWMLGRTNSIRRHAYEREVPARVAAVAARCLHAFALRAVPILCSADVPVPATIGFRRPVLLLPETFFTNEFSEDDLLSALSHEFAHIRRSDFILNLFSEFVHVAVCFHPFTAFIKSRIAHTRELACDEMAAGMLSSGSRYASSLLHIAQSVCSAGQSHSTYALGLFDSDTLEERIVNILNKTNENRTGRRSLRLLAVFLVGMAALGISAFSLKLSADNAGLQQFAGTWECKYKGKTFFTLKMAVQGATITGTAVHPDRLTDVDGELIPGSDENSTDKIVEAHASGGRLLLKLAHANDASAPPWPLQFSLTGKEEAEGILVADDPSERSSDPEQAPPPKKPWHFQRVSNSQ